MKRRLILAGICLLLLGCVYGFWKYKQSHTRRDADTATIVRQMRTLSRLETSSFTIEKIIDEGTHDFILKDLLFGDRILLVAHGEVIAGFDFANIEPSAIQIDGTSLTIHIGKPQILVTRLDNEKTKVYDRKRGLLTPGDSNLESQARADAESAIRAAACEDHILDRASENAKKQVLSLFQAAGFVNITVETEPAQCS